MADYSGPSPEPNPPVGSAYVWTKVVRTRILWFFIGFTWGFMFCRLVTAPWHTPPPRTHTVYYSRECRHPGSGDAP